LRRPRQTGERLFFLEALGSLAQGGGLALVVFARGAADQAAKLEDDRVGDGVEHVVAEFAAGDEAALEECSEVLGDIGLTARGAFAELGNGELAGLKSVEQAKALRLTEEAKPLSDGGEDLVGESGRDLLSTSHSCILLYMHIRMLLYFARAVSSLSRVCLVRPGGAVGCLVEKSCACCAQAKATYGRVRAGIEAMRSPCRADRERLWSR
jgi:hypothetical protein